VLEKVRVVIDTSVFVAAIFWRGSARECLVRFARRDFEAVVSEAILQEYAGTAWGLKIEENLPQNPQPWLNWIWLQATRLMREHVPASHSRHLIPS
jgi:predicted nucleic acid-binding protein